MNTAYSSLKGADLWVNLGDNNLQTPSVSTNVDSVLNTPTTQNNTKQKLTRIKLETVISKLVSIYEGFNDISDIQAVENIIKEIEYNLSWYKEKYSSVGNYSDQDMIGYYNRTILKGKDRIIMISLEKMVLILNSIEDNNLTQDLKSELEKLIANCQQITEIDNPQKIDIYIEKLEIIKRIMGIEFLDYSGISRLLYLSNGTKTYLGLKQENTIN